MSQFPFPQDENGYLFEHVNLMMNSYQKFLGISLIANSTDTIVAAKKLFYAPFAVVSHNADKDPIFNYANCAALKLFQLSWKEFTALHSRLSAEWENQQERTRLLAEVADKGFIEHYQGVRISGEGLRFLIKDAVVWNLVTEEHLQQGQAACFANWEFLNLKPSKKQCS